MWLLVVEMLPYVYRQLKKLSFDIYLTDGASKVRSLRKPRLQYCTEGCGIPSSWV